MTLVDGQGNLIYQTRGECSGEISRKQSGTNGFGYDPVFLVEKNRTMAEMSEDEKNLVSHRGKALRDVIKFIKSELM